MNDMTINGESDKVYMNMHAFKKHKEILNLREKSSSSRRRTCTWRKKHLVFPRPENF